MVTINTHALATISTGYGLVKDLENIMDAFEALWGSRPSVFALDYVIPVTQAHIEAVYPTFPTEEFATSFGEWPEAADKFSAYLTETFGETVEIAPIHATPVNDEVTEDQYALIEYRENGVVIRAGVGDDPRVIDITIPKMGLIDGVERNREHPGTFQIPFESEREKQPLGATVKVGYENGDGPGEKFWTTVVARLDNGDYLLCVDNDLVMTARHGLRYRDVVRASPRHIISLY